MRRLTVVLGVCLLAGLVVSPALADTLQVQYSITGSFSPSVDSSPLSGPNGTYSISFSLPQTTIPDYYDVAAGDFALLNVPLDYSFLCEGCATPSFFSVNAVAIDFANSASGGMLVVEFLTGGHDFYWQFAGDQLFSGTVDQPVLEACGPFYLTDSGVFELDSGDFTDVGNATVTAQTVATQEPSTVAMLLAALGALGVVALLKAPRS
jgi:hypothetical protein